MSYAFACVFYDFARTLDNIFLRNEASILQFSAKVVHGVVDVLPDEVLRVAKRCPCGSLTQASKHHAGHSSQVRRTLQASQSTGSGLCARKSSPLPGVLFSASLTMDVAVESECATSSGVYRITSTTTAATCLKGSAICVRLSMDPLCTLTCIH